MNLRTVVGLLSVGLAVPMTTVGQNLLDNNPGPDGSPNPNYNNPSFERPDVGSFSPSIDVWEESGPSIDIGGGFVILAGVGVFENPPDGTAGHLNGMDGTQAAWLFANSYPDFTTGQVMDHALTQVTQLTFQAGQQYQLSVNLANAQSPPPVNSVFTLSLFADAPGGEILLASTSLQNDGSTALNGVSFVPFTATTAPVAGAAIGQPIGIRFQTHTPPAVPSLTGQWDLDNVQLTIVPEPAGLALIVAAGLLSHSRIRRRPR